MISDNNKSSKSFKYTLQSKDGKILLQSIVTFKFPDKNSQENWKEDPHIQIALQNYKKTFIEENFDIIISEDLNLNI